MLSAVAEPRRHLSMLRSYTAADAFTIGNAACGTIAIFLCLDYVETGSPRWLWIAFALFPLALVCDVLDGYVARLDTGHRSVLGGDLDSLADVISFGVAPAVLGFTVGLRGAWDMLILTYFVVCGVSRLARFNVTASALTDAEHRQGEVLPGHTDPDQRGDRRRPCRRVLPRSHRRRPLVRGVADRAGDAASAGAALRRQRQRDDQRDAAGPQAVRRASR